MDTSKNLALFDLDHTLLPIDSDYEWGQFLCDIGAVDRGYFEVCNKTFYEQYQAGTLDPTEYLEFALATLAPFSATQLVAMHTLFMQFLIYAIRHTSTDRAEKHRSGKKIYLLNDAPKCPPPDLVKSAANTNPKPSQE